MDQVHDKEMVEIQKALDSGKLKKYFTLSIDYLRKNSDGGGGLIDMVEDTLRNYQMMMDCFKKGVDDPQRSNLLAQIADTAFQLYLYMQMIDAIQNDATLAAAHKRSLSFDFFSCVDYLKKHQYDEESISKVFSAILITPLLPYDVAQLLAEFMIDPDSPRRVSAVLISAIMLSSLCVDDRSKIKCLLYVYANSKDVYIRERALIAWVFSVSAAKHADYFNNPDAIKTFVEEFPDTVQELYEMQKQVIYCMDAEKDASEVSKTIMENMPTKDMMRDLKGDLDDFSMDEILYPEKEEEAMERFEQSVEKMIKMQKQGSDIYFDGFSKMKSFSFFHSLYNWFMPFYGGHHSLDKLRGMLGNDTFLKNLEKSHTFCDGDKYSFCFGVETTLKSHMQVLKPLLEESFMFTREDLEGEPETNPSMVRRMLLQDLFRFFKVSPFKKTFTNVFSEEEGSPAFFLGNKVFAEIGNNQKMRMKICNFLCKRKDYKRMWSFISKETENPEELFMASIYYIYGKNNYSQALACLKEIPMEGKLEQPLHKAFAKCYFEQKNYEAALEQFAKLFEAKPTDSLHFKMAYCMLKCNRVEEAMAILYELNYKNPKDTLVLRALGWGNMLRRKYDEAKSHYEQLKSLCEEDTSLYNVEDTYNYGLCLWLQKKIQDACLIFASYVSASKTDEDHIIDKLIEDREVLKLEELSPFDISLMGDCVASMLHE